MHLPGPLGNHAGHDDRDLRPAPQVRGCGPASTIQLSRGGTLLQLSTSPLRTPARGASPRPVPRRLWFMKYVPRFPLYGRLGGQRVEPCHPWLGETRLLRQSPYGNARTSASVVVPHLGPPTSKIGIRSNPTGPVASWGTPEGTYDLPTRPRLNGRPGRPGPFSDGSGA